MGGIYIVGGCVTASMNSPTILRVLRVGLGQARAQVSLSDGTRVEFGELVGTLHFWNEHLPRYSSKGPNLGWACAVRNRVIYSLRAFSEYIDSEAAWQGVRAIRTETALPARLGRCVVCKGCGWRGDKRHCLVRRRGKGCRGNKKWRSGRGAAAEFPVPPHGGFR